MALSRAHPTGPNLAFPVWGWLPKPPLSTKVPSAAASPMPRSGKQVSITILGHAGTDRRRTKARCPSESGEVTVLCRLLLHKA